MLELRKGTELEHRYVIHDVVGKGGYGSVWKASDKQLSRDVAIKRLLKTSIVASEDDLAGLLSEAQKNAQLVHTNIVQVYDIIHVGAEPLIVMEYVDGPSLYDFLRDKARRAEGMPLDQGVAILKDVLHGTAFAHGKSICHRDLSPMNILLTTSRVPKIADFGIARVLGAVVPGVSPSVASQGGTGNPYFMSPEQARGEPADFSSDLFMVGIIGYLLLAGRHPFAHPTGLFSIPELIADPDYAAEVPKPTASMTSSQQRLFREYAAVILRLLNREKAGRFGSATDAINAIEAVTPSLDCPACGERVPEHHRFCGFCGAKLAAEQLSAAALAPLPSTATSAEDLVDEGFKLTRLQRWQEAIQLYRGAIAADPNHQRAYWTLGFALNHVGNHEEAITVLENGLKLPSQNPEHLGQFYYALAFANSSLKRYDEALKQANEALVLQPGSPRVLYLRARVYLYLGHLDEARSDAGEVLRRDPDHTGALRLLDEIGSLER